MESNGFPEVRGDPKRHRMRYRVALAYHFLHIISSLRMSYASMHYPLWNLDDTSLASQNEGKHTRDTILQSVR